MHKMHKMQKIKTIKNKKKGQGKHKTYNSIKYGGSYASNMVLSRVRPIQYSRNNNFSNKLRRKYGINRGYEKHHKIYMISS